MPPQRIAPPPSALPGSLAAVLPRMPISALLLRSYQRESDEAMRMAKEAGLPIRADYRFQTQPA